MRARRRVCFRGSHGERIRQCFTMRSSPLSIIAGLLSGVLWLFAACIRVPTDLSSGYGGTVEGLDEMRFGFRRQANWNAAAAIATAVAALCQAVALLFA